MLTSDRWDSPIGQGCVQQSILVQLGWNEP